MLRRIVGLIAMAVVLSGQTVPPAAPREPTAKWVIDYQDGLCVLSRRYGDGGEAVDLAFRPGPTPARVEIVMSSAPGGLPRTGRGAWSLDGRPDVIATYDSYRVGNPARHLTTLWVDGALLEAMRTASVLSIAADRGRLSFRLRAVAAGLNALSACQDDLLRRWGVDPAAAHALAAPATLADRDVAAWFGPDAYPTGAIRANAQGLVVAVVSVDAAGKAIACRVARGSGNADLDTGTCGIVVRRARFTPARDRQGKAAASSYIMPVRWLLPSG